MNCNNQPSRVTQEDFACVGDIAVNCDQKKLCIAINDAMDFDLRPLLCDFFNEAFAVWDEVQAYQDAVKACEEDPECETPPVEPVNYAEKLMLICGGDFYGCNSATNHHLGLKKLLLYYSYARYLPKNGYNDTPTGVMVKTNEFAMSAPLKEVQAIADEYRTKGYETFKGLASFICANHSLFNSSSCTCGKCDRNPKAVGYGVSGSIIKKSGFIKKRRGHL